MIPHTYINKVLEHYIIYEPVDIHTLAVLTPVVGLLSCSCCHTELEANFPSHPVTVY